MGTTSCSSWADPMAASACTGSGSTTAGITGAVSALFPYRRDRNPPRPNPLVVGAVSGSCGAGMALATGELEACGCSFVESSIGAATGNESASTKSASSSSGAVS